VFGSELPYRGACGLRQIESSDLRFVPARAERAKHVVDPSAQLDEFRIERGYRRRVLGICHPLHT
jgi:hypothetical protein